MTVSIYSKFSFCSKTSFYQHFLQQDEDTKEEGEEKDQILTLIPASPCCPRSPVRPIGP